MGKLNQIKWTEGSRAELCLLALSFGSLMLAGNAISVSSCDSHERTLISWCVLCTLNSASRSHSGQHLLFPALLQLWYCSPWIWRPCVFVPSTDNDISVKNHHVLFVLILFPSAWDVLGVILTAGCHTGQGIFICWIYKEGVDCSCNE